MILFKRVQDLSLFLGSARAKGQSIGFVPTMGALHDGHLSLLEAARPYSDLVVCSIFVNPTQFNQASDLANYPRTESADIARLLRAECDILFLPSVEAIYPPDLEPMPTLDFGQLEHVMEGKFRPGHFAGVAQVVYRLLQIVAPHRLFMGQKDFQQVAIVREMLRQTGLPAALHMCPTVREPDGLAMSSRNQRLSPAGRTLAPEIFRTLRWAADQAPFLPLPEIAAAAMARLAALPDFRPEYVEFADGFTLQPVESYAETSYIALCAAVWVGEVRLIDNLEVKRPTL